MKLHARGLMWKTFSDYEVGSTGCVKTMTGGRGKYTVHMALNDKDMSSSGRLEAYMDIEEAEGFGQRLLDAAKRARELVAS